MAAAEGNLDEVKRLVENGVDINKGDYDNRTALHLGINIYCNSHTIYFCDVYF